MTEIEQAQELKNAYVIEYENKYRVNKEEDNNMKLSQKELELKANEIKREYMRKYRKAHREQNRQYMKTYWEKKALEMN